LDSDFRKSEDRMNLESRRYEAGSRKETGEASP
jgi:hypothetical protein